MHRQVNRSHQELDAGEIHRILEVGFPYYGSLGISEQARFISRLVLFCQRKEFQQYGLDQIPQIPVLISAAAIQLTFGLRRYRMRFFQTFHVYREAYYSPDSPRRLIGHVRGHEIHLSWKHFLEGYGNYTDKQNVGLHELAHALEYTTFVVGSNINHRFVEGFQQFRRTGGSLYYKMRINGHPFFSSYAAHSFQEFWAECVECFFEAPAEFRDQLPDLYRILCQMLNQDPLEKRALLVRRRRFWPWTD